MADYPGTRKRIAITVTDETVTPAALADPTTLVVKYARYPDSATTVTWSGVNNAIVKDSTGTFHIDIDCTEDGDWHALITTTGVVGATIAQWTITRAPL